MKIVKAVNLKKYFVTENYEVHAVDGVTLEIEEGEFVAVVGTSGVEKLHFLIFWEAWMCRTRAEYGSEEAV